MSQRRQHEAWTGSAQPLLRVAQRPSAIRMAEAGAARVLWLLIAVACQFVWGTYPAAVRYLQTKAAQPLTSLQLSLLVNLLACPALLFGTTIPTAISRACARRRAKKQRVQYGIAESAAAVAAAAAEASTPSPRSAANGKAPGWKRERLGDSALAEPLLAPEDGPAEAASEKPLPPSAPAAKPAADGQADLEAGPASASAAEQQQGDVAALPALPRLATSPPEPASPREPEGPSVRRQALVLCGTTFFLCFLFLTQVFALLFTTAYLSQMVFLLAPVMVALLARALFKSPLPKGLWPALFFMLLGCGMVIGSKAMAAGKKSTGPAGAQLAADRHVSLWAGRGEQAWLCAAAFGDSPLARLCAADAPAGQQQGAAEAGSSAGGWSDGAAGDGGALDKKKRPHPKPKPSGLGMRDVIGITLSFVSASCLAGFMLVVQRTEGTVSNQQVLWGNFLTQAVLVFVLETRFEPGRIFQLLDLGWQELGAVAGLAAGVNWFGNLVQQTCIKKLGAPTTASFLPVRLLGSLAASYPLLNEGLAGPVQWGGCALLLAAVTWYLTQQKAGAEHDVAEEALAADVAAEQGEAPAQEEGEPSAPPMEAVAEAYAFSP